MDNGSLPLQSKMIQVVWNVSETIALSDVESVTFNVESQKDRYFEAWNDKCIGLV